MTHFIIILIAIFFTPNVNQADNILQTVLNLQEVESYFVRSPRLVTSNPPDLILFKKSTIKLDQTPTINSRRIKVLDVENFSKENLIAYLHLDFLEMEGEVAEIKLIIQNAELLQEDNSQILVSAQLMKVSGNWEIKNYTFEKISISY